MEDNHVKFDFLGKDSIRYENMVEVHPRVYELVREFRGETKASKSPHQSTPCCCSHCAPVTDKSSQGLA